MIDKIDIEETRIGKQLYDYQSKAIENIFEHIDRHKEENHYSLLYQLPTGGGKTVIFSEITRKFIRTTNKKVLILTHRIELCKQTANMLNEFGVNSMVIDSKVKELPEQNEYMCFIAMVETLNNRLNEEVISIEDLGLVIVDEAHYNSFTKLFKFFDQGIRLGVTATPLSSNIEFPMKDNYKELIVGESISSLIQSKYLSKADYYNYDVGLASLKVGRNGDYTVSSSELLYANTPMQEMLLRAYRERSFGKKTLIFNHGIRTSRQVFYNFRDSGYKIRHLDNTNSSKERKEILTWFKETPDAILTSVGILTTGFDEPTVESIILNRATRSLTLYFQMIGRGSRVLPDKSQFTLIDLGNNMSRFGPWDGDIPWKRIFEHPDQYLQNLILDEDIERQFRYVMPDDIRVHFSKSENVDFDIYEEYDKVVAEGLRSHEVIERAINQHVIICVENSEDVYDARSLAKMLEHDIAQRIKKYAYCISKSTLNYRRWLIEDYHQKLRARLNKSFS